MFLERGGEVCVGLGFWFPRFFWWRDRDDTKICTKDKKGSENDTKEFDVVLKKKCFGQQGGIVYSKVFLQSKYLRMFLERGGEVCVFIGLGFWFPRFFWRDDATKICTKDKKGSENDTKEFDE